MASPLAHIRVLDLSRAFAGPLTAQILGDLGADVIKVERPVAGDETRTWGPPFLADRDGNATHESGYYLSVNRGKRSIALDLSTSEGQRVVRALAERSDVLVENFKVGTLARFGLAYDDLKALNPGLVLCSLTGFGQTGPRRGEMAYDAAIQAMGGLMSVTGKRDDEPGGGPVKIGVPIVDMTTGLYGAIAVLAALTRRAETGSGEHIDIGMLDVTVSILMNHAVNFLLSGREPQRSGNTHPYIQPQDVYECRDGGLALVVGNDAQFGKLCEAIGDTALALDERFATNAARVHNLPELRPRLAARLSEETRAHWLERLGAFGVPCAPLNSVAELLADPQVEHRGMQIDLEHPLAGTVPQIASPMRFREAPLKIERAPPLLDEHRAAILEEVGLESEQLRQRGVA